MAAHDDKISNNRRRLFKALSAAPIVSTLSPGSALATASAYQCLNNVPSPGSEFQDSSAVLCTSGEPDCFPAQSLRCWDITDRIKVHNGSYPSELDALFLTLESNGVLVETAANAAPSPSGIDISLLEYPNGDPVNLPYTTPGTNDPYAVQMLSDGTLAFTDPAGVNNPKTYFTVSVGTCYGMYLVQPNGDGTAITPKGFVPDVQPGIDGQGITGTCLTSFIPGATVGDSLIKG